MKKPPQARIDLFWSKTKKVGDCIEWMGCRDRGYGKVGFMGEKHPAHRVAWYLKFGKFPELCIDHLCRNHACVNVDHMEDVSRGENVLRGICLAAINKRKTHCYRGHELSGDNLYTSPRSGNRRCLQCKKIWRKARRMK